MLNDMSILVLQPFFKTTSTRLNETWGLRRREVGLLPTSMWSVGHAAAGWSLSALGAPTPGRR